MLLSLRSLYETQIEVFPGRSFLPSQSQGVVDPWTGVNISSEEVLQKVAQQGVHRCDAAYLAATHPLSAPFDFGGGEVTSEITVAFGRLPVQRSSPDEVHYLASIHEATAAGVEVFSIGVTPSGRMACRTQNRGIIQSGIGAIVPDESPRRLTLFSTGQLRQIGLDGVVLVEDDLAGGVDGPFSATGLPCRAMLFNGGDGLTRCDCTISEWIIAGENHPIRWPFFEGQGLLLQDQEYGTFGGSSTVWRDRTATLLPLSDYPGLWPLTIQWYNPSSIGRPLLLGSVPTSSPGSCANWHGSTAYRRRNPAQVDYRPVLLQ